MTLGGDVAEHRQRNIVRDRCRGSLTFTSRMTDAESPPTVDRVRAEYHRGARCGIGEPAPRLSWITTTERPCWMQAAYEVEIDGTPPVGSIATSRCSCRGPARRCVRATARRVGCESGAATDRASPWSDPLDVEAGLLVAATTGRRRGSRRRRPRRPASAAALPPIVSTSTGATSSGARLYVTVGRHPRARTSTARRRRHVLAPGWTSYDHRLRYETHDVTDARRSRARTRSARSSPTAGSAAASAGSDAQRLRRPARPARPARDHLRRRHDRRRSPPTSEWRDRDRSDPARPTSTTARPTTPGSSSTAGIDRGFDDAAWAPAELFEPDVGRARRADRARRCGGPRSSRVRRGARRRRRARRSLDFGQNLVGRVRHHGRRRGGHGRHAAPRRGARRRRARHPPAAQRRGDRPLHAARRRPGDLGAALHLPRLPLRRGRRLAGRARPGRLRRGRLPLRPRAHRLRSTCSDPLLEPAPRERRLEHARQLPRRPDRLPAARRAARLDRRHPGLRADRDVPLRRRRLPRLWLARPRAPSSATDGRVPLVVPSRRPARARATRRPRRGATPPTSCPGRCTSATATRQLLAASSTACGRWVDCVAPSAGDRLLWRADFQFGDWLDPTAPPDRPGAARTDPALVATAYFARSAQLVARCRGRARRDDDARRDYAGLADAGARGVPRASTCTERAARSATRRPRTRSRSSSASSTTPERRARAGDAARRSSSRGDELPHRDRLRRHAARLRRALRHGDTTTAYRLLTADARARPGSTRSRWGRRRSGSAGTACCPTARSTRAR